MSTERFKLFSAVHLFLVENEEILLIRRANTGYEDGKWSVPAGYIDGNESVTQAMVRESREEINIIINPQQLHVCHVMHRKNGERESIDFFLFANKWTGVPKNNEPEKCSDVEWFSLSDFPLLLSTPYNVIPYILSAIENGKKGIQFSEFGWH